MAAFVLCAAIWPIAVADPLELPATKAPGPAPAQAAQPSTDRGANTTNLQAEREALAAILKPGRAAGSYRDQLIKQGFQVTAVNDAEPGYVEYEVVKGRNSHEVQIDVDRATGLATQVNVVVNLWRADTTLAALAGRDVQHVNTGDQYSDRAYLKPWTEEKARVERALAVGHTRAFYPATLTTLGYRVTSVDIGDPQRIEYEIVRGPRSYEVHLQVDPHTGKVHTVEVTSNLWESEATARALAAARGERQK